MKTKRTQAGISVAGARTPSADWVEQLKKTLTGHVLKGDYHGGLKVAREARERYPDNVDVRYQYAKLLGDWADELPAKAQAKAKREAIAILKPITRALGGRPFDFRFGVCLNYYYQKRDFRGMHRFGKRMASLGHRKGHYAQGVAGAHQAKVEHERGNSRGQAIWARSAVRAWKNYGLRSEKYYFAHYCSAMAHALAGDAKTAMSAIKTAARLSKRPVSDWEFKDVLSLVDGIHSEQQ